MAERARFLVCGLQWASKSEAPLRALSARNFHNTSENEREQQFWAARWWFQLLRELKLLRLLSFFPRVCDRWKTLVSVETKRFTFPWVNELMIRKIQRYVVYKTETLASGKEEKFSLSFLVRWETWVDMNLHNVPIKHYRNPTATAHPVGNCGVSLLSNSCDHVAPIWCEAGRANLFGYGLWSWNDQQAKPKVCTLISWEVFKSKCEGVVAADCSVNALHCISNALHIHDVAFGIITVLFQSGLCCHNAWATLQLQLQLNAKRRLRPKFCPDLLGVCACVHMLSGQYIVYSFYLVSVYSKSTYGWNAGVASTEEHGSGRGERKWIRWLNPGLLFGNGMNPCAFSPHIWLMHASSLLPQGLCQPWQKEPMSSSLWWGSCRTAFGRQLWWNRTTRG